MKFSKFPLLIAITASLVLAACGERRTQNGEESGFEPDTYAEHQVISGNATFRVESINAVGTSLVSEKSTKWGMAKTKVYNFRACMRDLVLRDPIIRTKFTIGDGENRKSVRTDSDGCLLWSESFDVNLTMPETLFEMTRTFTAQETYAGSVALTFAFNPWANGEAVIDLRKEAPPIKPEKIGGIKAGGAPTKLWKYPTSWSPYVSPSSIAFKYAGEAKDQTRVTEALSLEIAHNYEVRFSPSLMTRNMIGQWNGHDLTEGKVKLRIYFVKENTTSLRQEDIISSFEHTFTILEDKSAFARIVLPISNVADASSRMKAIAEITPVDDDVTGMQTAYFEGLVDPLTSSSFAIEFNPNPRTDNRIQSLFAALDVPVVEKKTATLNGILALEKYSGLKHDLLPDLKDKAEKLLAGQVTGDLNKDVLFAQSLCEKVYTEDLVKLMSKDNSSCKGRFFSSLPKSVEISVEDVVVSVLGAAKKVGSTRELSLSIANSFNYSTEFSKSSGGSLKSSGGVGIPFGELLKFATGIKLDLGGEVYAGTAWDNKLSHGTSGSASQSETITAIANTYEFEVSYKRCLIYKMKDANQALLGDNLSRVKVGSYYCSDKVQKKKARETFYFVNQTVAPSAFTDSASADSTKWRMMVRGKREFDVFKQIVSEPSVVLNFERLSQEINGDKLPKEFRMTQKYPGILSGD